VRPIVLAVFRLITAPRGARADSVERMPLGERENLIVIQYRGQRVEGLALVLLRHGAILDS